MRTSGVADVLMDKESGTPATALENTEEDPLHPRDMDSTATPTGTGLLVEETRMLEEEQETQRKQEEERPGAPRETLL